MCGIAGFVEFSNPSSSVDDLLTMQRSIRHRGPDDRGDFYTTGVGLCHTRLAIIDLSDKAHQPMQRDNLTIVYNGEIYNFKELREQLMQKGHTFRSTSDTEVVLMAYKEWGKEAVKRFNGMFAFAVYDQHNKTIFFARDRLGIKPLYYYYDGSCFVFSSEIKAIRAYPRFKKEISQSALRDYLHFGYINGKQTIWENCFRLLPGQYASISLSDKTIETQTFWNPYFSSESSDDFEMTKQKLKAILIEEFRDSTVSDVPVGVCISGGVDSNVLISLLVKELGIKLKTYSLAGREAKYDENKQASAVAEFLKTDHTNIILDAANCRDLLLDTISHYDEPVSDQNFLSYRLIAQEARKDGVPVLLSGAGGDELFLGYPSVFLRSKMRSLYKIPKVVRNMIPRSMCNFSNYLYKGVQLLQQDSDVSAISSITGNCFFDDEVNRLLPKAAGSNGMNYFDSLLLGEYPNRTSFLEKIMRCDLMCFLPADILSISDVSTMAEGVEMRVPYLNNRVVDFALNVPTSVKNHKGSLKAPLRSIEGDYLPQSLLFKGKRGFNPFIKSVWLDTYFSGLVDSYLSADKIKKQGLFDPDALRELTLNQRGSKVNVANKIWNMLVFQIWAEKKL